MRQREFSRQMVIEPYQGLKEILLRKDISNIDSFEKIEKKVLKSDLNNM
jgi:hypothetical protein